MNKARILYESRQDFYARMAKHSAPNPALNKYLPRSLVEASQTTFEAHLHEAMGYRSHTVSDWNV